MFSRSFKFMPFSKFILCLSFAAILSLFLHTISHAQNIIKIGVGLDKAGHLDFLGNNIHHAMKLAIEEINSKGGCFGNIFELIVFDTKSSHEKRISLLKKAILIDRVDFLIGPFGLRSVNSGIVSFEKDLLHRHKTPMINFKPNIPYPQPHRYILQISPDIFMQAYAVSKWAEKNTNLKNYVAIGPKAFNKFFTKSIKHSRPDMKKLKEFYPDYNTKDFATFIHSIRKIEPNIIISTIRGIYLEEFLKQSIDNSLFDKIKFIGNFNTFALTRMGSSMINGLYGYSSAPFYALDQSAIESLLYKFKNEKVPYPFDEAIMAYDSIWVLAQAIKRAGTVDKEKVLDELIKGGFDSLRGILEGNVPVFIGEAYQNKNFFNKYKFYSLKNVQKAKVDDCNDEKCRCDDGSCKRACCKK